MPDLAIRTEQLGKRYHLMPGRARYGSARETLTGLVRRPWRRRQNSNHVWALREVSFSVAPGQAVGVIGRNGAGKSTLLKLLARISEPTTGMAEVRGRVGSLLEVGTGFHPELTGRENIFLSGAILGMRRREIRRKFDAIVDFAEVERFIDTPVKHYSSGMGLRLAFSVAAHLEPEILLVDEVLAVGDLAFQRKCLGRMQSVGSSGQTILFVSHDMTAIANLASHSVLLEGGRVAYWGPTSDAIRMYTARGEGAQVDLGQRTDRSGDGLIRVERLAFRDGRGQTIDSLPSGEPLTIAVTYRSELTRLGFDDLALDMRITDALGHPVTTLSTRFSQPPATLALESSGVLECLIPSLALAEDTYGVDVWLAYRGGLADCIEGAAQLQVISADFYGTGQEPVRRKHGAALTPHEWRAGERPR
jgi:lipopolysaccharide transport system ATP-binding protein